MKKSLAVVLSSAMALSVFATSAFAADAPSTETQYNTLKDAGIFEGTDNGPALDANMTRAQFAKVIDMLKGLSQDTASASVYTDLDGSGWATGFIGAATKAKLMDGVATGKFDPTGEVTIEQLATVAVRAFDLPLSTDAVAGKVSDWAKGYVAAAIKAGLITAKADYTIKANRGLLVNVAYTAREMMMAPVVASATATLNSDNTATVTGKVGGKVTAVKVTVGTASPVNATLNADGTFTFTTGVLANGDTTLSVVAYQGETASAAKTATVTVSAFAVQSVSQVNARQYQVVFNSTVGNGTTGTGAQNPANYTVSGVNVTAAALQADNKTVLLTVDGTIPNGTATTVTVSPVLKAGTADSTTTLYASALVVSDKTAPTVASIASSTNGTSAGTAVLTFSEPVVQGATFKIDGVSVATNWTSNTSVTLTASLDATKAHTLEVLNLQDLANPTNTSVYLSQSFNVTVDTAVPVVSSVTASGDNAILVTYSKPVTLASVQAAIPTGAANVSAVKDELYNGVTTGVITAVSSTQYQIPVAQALYGSSNTRTLTVVIGPNVVDTLGNKAAASVQTVTLSKDTVAPTVTGISFKKNSAGNVTDLVLTFSENVQGAAAASNVTVVDSNGVLKNGFFATANGVVSGNTVDFPVAGTVSSGTYSFTFAGGLVTDMAQAPVSSAAYSASLNFGTASSSTSNVSVANVTNNGTNVFVVDFGAGNVVKGGAVAGSATDVNNYTLNGLPLASGTTITLDSTQRYATITLPAGSIATTDSKAVINVKNVQTTGGTNFNTYVGTVVATDNTKPVLQSVQAIGNSIYALYNEAVTTDGNTAAYAITVNGAALTNSYTVVALPGNTKGIQINITGTGNYDVTGTIVVTTVAGSHVKDSANNDQASGTAVTATK